MIFLIHCTVGWPLSFDSSRVFNTFIWFDRAVIVYSLRSLWYMSHFKYNSAHMEGSWFKVPVFYFNMASDYASTVMPKHAKEEMFLMDGDGTPLLCPRKKSNRSLWINVRSVTGVILLPPPRNDACICMAIHRVNCFMVLQNNPTSFSHLYLLNTCIRIKATIMVAVGVFRIKCDGFTT